MLLPSVIVPLGNILTPKFGAELLNHFRTSDVISNEFNPIALTFESISDELSVGSFVADMVVLSHALATGIMDVEQAASKVPIHMFRSALSIEAPEGIVGRTNLI